MIHVTQGHERGIGPEVFLKSYVCLSNKLKNKIIFYCSKNAITRYLKDYKIKYEIKNSSLHFWGDSLNCYFCDNNKNSPSLTLLAINTALDKIQKKEILITLPSSKDQFVLNGKKYVGHTDYLNQYSDSGRTTMSFYTDSQMHLLITDHLPLSQVPILVNSKLIREKILHGIQFFSPSEVYIAGLNPHAGENGLLGEEEKGFYPIIKDLQTSHPKIKIIGPLPGDTLHFYQNSKVRQLFVYMYHDQALAKFKAINQTLGVNQTLGLDFIRLSVDHGTAFDLYGKNCADYSGQLYTLKYAEKLLNESR